MVANKKKNKRPAEVKSECDDESSIKTQVAQVSIQARKAIDALQKFYAEKDLKDKSLFPDIDYALYLHVVYKKAAIHKGSSVAKKISLPYSFRSNATVCLIVKDRLRRAIDRDRHETDVDREAREYVDELFRQESITTEQIAKVITKRQLEREYHTYNERRNLLATYDVFLIDSCVHKSVLTFLGKEMHRAHKPMVAVNMKAPLLGQIAKADRVTTLDVSPLKTRISVRVGHLALDADQLADNVDACLFALWRLCPGGPNNIHALYLQPPNSTPSLPIYAHFGSANNVKIENVRVARSKEIRDELSCLPEGLAVAVRRNGRIRVVDEKTNKTVAYPTITDEFEPRDDLKPTLDPMTIERKRKRRKRKLAEKAKRKKPNDSSFKFEPITCVEGSVIDLE
jgi:ribosome biogenesis protein UTP30